jgi:hypothetical protein
MTTVVLSSVIANKPFNGGNAWAVLSWVLGLKALGFDVYFVEQIGREGCLGADGAVVPFGHSENLAYFEQVMEEFGLADSATVIYQDGEQVRGRDLGDLLAVAEDAELLVNISGHLTFEPLMRRLRRKAYVDLDPGFTQFWHQAGGQGARLEGHDLYFTVGENIGTPSCFIPTGDIRWRPIRQPVVLDQWPVSKEGDRGRFTTVASWRGAFGPILHEGRMLGLKVHEFRKFVALPPLAPQAFEIALDIHPADDRDLRLLEQHGWRIVNPRAVAADPAAFREYVRRSGAEFSVAQGIYVETQSGWFSDRTIRYLASGKPALVQDTGFSRNYPVGEGLLTFRTMAEAVAGAERIAQSYDQHCRAARSLAEEYFDAAAVLGRFVDEIGVTP